jgi:hypothetical protein
VTRIVAFLALLSLSLMAVAMMLGLQLGNLHAATYRYQVVLTELHRFESHHAVDDPRMAELAREQDELEQKLHWATIHRLFGVAAALVAVLVNSIVITYFVGTSRWCKEVVETYGLDPSLALRSARLKRRTFPWATAGMLTVVAISALGAAADPMARFVADDGGAMPHLIAALAGAALLAWAFFAEWNNVAANHEAIEKIMAAVKRVRAERGLTVD